MKYSPKEIQNKLVKYDFNFKKKYGQNFIIDENIVNNIIKLSNIDKETLVIEVGPGLGALTYKLCESANFVICYEIDKSLEQLLNDNLKYFSNKKIIFQDFLKVDLKSQLKNYNYKKLYLVSNLPYYITTPIITKLIEDQIDVDKIVVMVQKEVGERFIAKPNTKEYNSLSIFLQYNFSIKRLLTVSKNVFMPKPNVDSIVVEFTKNRKAFVKDLDLFYKLVKDSFIQKRKTIKNNLKNYDLNKISNILKKYDLDLSARAEQLDIEIFIDIANNL